MPVRLKCPHGHQWDSVLGSSTEAPAGPVSCPVCGASVELRPQAGELESTNVETIVHTPSAELAQHQLTEFDSGRSDPSAGVVFRENGATVPTAKESEK